MGRNPSRSVSSGYQNDERYDRFLTLCREIENMINKSMEDLSKQTNRKINPEKIIGKNAIGKFFFGI